MKIKEMKINEGILDSLRNIRTSVAGTPQEIGAQKARYDMIRNLVAAVDQSVRAGETDLDKTDPTPADVPSSVEPAAQSPEPKVEPTAQELDLDAYKKRREQEKAAGVQAQQDAMSQMKQTAVSNAASSAADNQLAAQVKAEKQKPGYQQDRLLLKRGAEKGIYERRFRKLNAIFESLLEAGEEPQKMSLYDFLKQQTVNLLPNLTSKELQFLHPQLEILAKSWKKSGQRNEALTKWAYMVQRVGANRRNSSAAEQGASQNAQQQYTDSLNKQIERMTTDYKDDIPKIVDALITRLQQIDPTGFKALIDKVKTLPAGATSPSAPTTTTESKRPRRRA